MQSGFLHGNLCIAQTLPRRCPMLPRRCQDIILGLLWLCNCADTQTDMPETVMELFDDWTVYSNSANLFGHSSWQQQKVKFELKCSWKRILKKVESTLSDFPSKEDFLLWYGRFCPHYFDKKQCMFSWSNTLIQVTKVPWWIPYFEFFVEGILLVIVASFGIVGR